jgi:hypothetical protein
LMHNSSGHADNSKCNIPEMQESARDRVK